MAGKVQDKDIKSEAELIGKGADKTFLPNTTKMYTNKSADVLETVLRFNNFTAIVAPTINNDSSQGYEIGSEWIDTVTDTKFNCVDATVAAAVWKQAGGGGASQFRTIGTGGDFVSFTAAHAGALTDEKFIILNETIVEPGDLIVTKRLQLVGSGRASVIQGNVTFATGSNGFGGRDFTFDGDWVVNKDIVSLMLTSMWRTVTSSIFDNSERCNENMFLILKEEV